MKIQAENKTIVFSGDLGNYPGADHQADGNDQRRRLLPHRIDLRRPHSRRRGQAAPMLERTIEDTVKAGGTLMIPTFAMERTQELLYALHRLFEKAGFRACPFSSTARSRSSLRRSIKSMRMISIRKRRNIVKSGDDILNFPGLHLTLTSEQSKEINEVKPPKIVIAGSGMSNGGRILHHEMRYLPGSEKHDSLRRLSGGRDARPRDFGGCEGSDYFWRESSRAVQDGEHPGIFRACRPAASFRVALGT